MKRIPRSGMSLVASQAFPTDEQVDLAWELYRESRVTSTALRGWFDDKLWSRSLELAKVRRP